MQSYIEAWEWCSDCQVSFTSERAAKAHLESRKHLKNAGKEVVWKSACSSCGKHFSRDSDRRRHEEKNQCRERRHPTTLAPRQPDNVQHEDVIDLTERNGSEPYNMNEREIVHLARGAEHDPPKPPPPVVSLQLSSSPSSIRSSPSPSPLPSTPYLASSAVLVRDAYQEQTHALAKAIKSKDVEEVRSMLESGIDPNVLVQRFEFEGQKVSFCAPLRPLSYAVQLSNFDLVTLLCSYGAILEYDEDLLDNIINKDFRILRTLLRNGLLQYGGAWERLVSEAMVGWVVSHANSSVASQYVHALRILVEHVPPRTFLFGGEVNEFSDETDCVQVSLGTALRLGSRRIVEVISPLRLDKLTIHDPDRRPKSVLEVAALRTVKNKDEQSLDNLLDRFEIIKLLLKSANHRWSSETLSATGYSLLAWKIQLMQCERTCSGHHEEGCSLIGWFPREGVVYWLSKVGGVCDLIEHRLRAFGRKVRMRI